MGSGTYGFAPQNLLLIVVVFGLTLLLPGSGRWRKPVVRETAAKGPRPLKAKTGTNGPICQAEQGAIVKETRMEAVGIEAGTGKLGVSWNERGR